ncbi:MAG: hypothetical protein ACOX5R_04195 [bacterium]
MYPNLLTLSLTAWLVPETMLFGFVAVVFPASLLLYLLLRQRARTFHIRQRNWYIKRCKTLVQRHALNPDEEGSLYGRQSLQIKPRIRGTYYQPFK